MKFNYEFTTMQQTKMLKNKGIYNKNKNYNKPQHSYHSIKFKVCKGYDFFKNKYNKKHNTAITLKPVFQ